MKRLLLGLFTAVLSLSLMTGCGTTNDNNDQINNDRAPLEQNDQNQQDQQDRNLNDQNNNNNLRDDLNNDTDTRNDRTNDDQNQNNTNR